MYSRIINQCHGFSGFHNRLHHSEKNERRNHVELSILIVKYKRQFTKAIWVRTIVLPSKQNVFVGVTAKFSLVKNLINNEGSHTQVKHIHCCVSQTNISCSFLPLPSFYYIRRMHRNVWKRLLITKPATRSSIIACHFLYKNKAVIISGCETFRSFMHLPSFHKKL